MHNSLHFIYIIKETDWEGLGTHRKKASLQSYRYFLQSNNTKHLLLPCRNPPGTGVRRSSKVADRIGRRANRMVQAVPGGQTAKLCAPHEGCSLVGLGAGEKLPLGYGQQITLRGLQTRFGQDVLIPGWVSSKTRVNIVKSLLMLPVVAVASLCSPCRYKDLGHEPWRGTGISPQGVSGVKVQPAWRMGLLFRLGED